MNTDLDEAVQRAISRLTLGISDALGPSRPVSGVQTGERRRSKLLLRAMKEAYADLAAADARVAYSNLDANAPTPPPIVEYDPLVSVLESEAKAESDRHEQGGPT